MVEQDKVRNTYEIPANYKNSGRWIQGKFEPRNVCETVVMVGLSVYLEMKFISAGMYVKLCIAIPTAMILGIFGLIGIDGDSFTQFIWRMICFLKKRRKLHMRRVGWDYNPPIKHKRKKIVDTSYGWKQRRYENDDELAAREHLEKIGRVPRDKKRFTQDYIPIKNIRDGIIETEFGHYVKIIEVTPINFSLLSDREKEMVIESFANWLKIAPPVIQIKSVTKRSDFQSHIDSIHRDMEQETNEKCRELGEEHIKMVQEIGIRESLTRSYYIVFPYYPTRAEGNNFDRAKEYLVTAANNAAVYLKACGNVVVKPFDPTTASREMLYDILNRRSSNGETFADRVDRVMRDTMRFFHLDPEKDKFPGEFPLKDSIAPRGLDFSHPGYIISDGQYQMFMVAKGESLPRFVFGGWVSNVINTRDGIDVDIIAERKDRGHTVDSVGIALAQNSAKLNSLAPTSADYEEVAGSINGGIYIKNQMASAREDLHDVSILITLSAPTLDDLYRQRDDMMTNLKTSNLEVSYCKFRQEEAYLSTLPICLPNKRLLARAKRNMMTSGLASTYMFTAFELHDDNGFMLGLNQDNYSMCTVDLFNSKKYKNANMAVMGTSGSGKTYCVQNIALRMRMRRIKTFIIVPEKGHEYMRACTAIGGSFIRIAPGSPYNINVMDVRPVTDPDMKLLDGDFVADDSLLAGKIQQLLVFFSLVLQDITYEEEHLLATAIVKTYASYGITYDNNSLYDEYGNLKTMPIIGDIMKFLDVDDNTKRLRTMVNSFISGYISSFNARTNVDLDNRYIVFDLSRLTENLLPLGMKIAMDYAWDDIRSNVIDKKCLIIEEAWKMIGTNALVAKECLQIAKVIRGYGGSVVFATQELHDFFALADGLYGRSIVNNCKTKIILNLEPEEADYVKELLKLTESEIKKIIGFERGEALLISNTIKVHVEIRASYAEHSLITTDRNDLARIVEEEKKRRLI